MSGNDWVYGVHAVESLLKHHPDSVLQLYVLHSRSDERLKAVLAGAAQRGIPVAQLSRAELDAKTGGVHQGLAALCRELKLEKSEGFLKQLLDGLEHPPFLLVLDGVTDPHNLGACLRSADAAGVDAVIVPKDKSALMTATARKVACGAAEVVPFIAVTNLVRCLEALKQRGIWVQGAAGEAGQSIYETDLTGPLAIVLGSEGEGMRRLTRETCDETARLPIKVTALVDSLNVSNAAAVALHALTRPRR